MAIDITQYIVRGLIILVTVSLSLSSLILLKHFKGSRFETPIRFFAWGFIFVAVAKFIAIGTKLLIENQMIPKTLKWIMSVYEVLGMVGLIIVVIGIYNQELCCYHNNIGIL